MITIEEENLQTFREWNIGQKVLYQTDETFDYGIIQGYEFSDNREILLTIDFIPYRSHTRIRRVHPSDLRLQKL